MSNVHDRFVGQCTIPGCTCPNFRLLYRADGSKFLTAGERQAIHDEDNALRAEIDVADVTWTSTSASGDVGIYLYEDVPRKRWWQFWRKKPLEMWLPATTDDDNTGLTVTIADKVEPDPDV